MQGRALGLRVRNRFEQRVIGEKITVADGFCDTGQFLVDNPAGADVGMADLGIAHLAVRQSDVHAAGADHGVRVFSQITVDIGCFGRLDGIADGFVVDPETVQNDQGDGTFG